MKKRKDRKHVEGKNGAKEEKDIEMEEQIESEEKIENKDGARLLQNKSLSESQKNLPEAIKYIEEIELWGGLPHLYVLEKVVYILYTLGEVETIQKYLSLVRQKGVIPSARMYNLYVSSLSQAGRFEEAMRAVQEAKELGRNIYIGTLNSLLRKTMRLMGSERALQMFETYKDEAIPVENRSYTIAIEICGKSRQLDRAKVYIEEMKRRGITPDIITYRTIIDICAKEGDKLSAWKYFNEMKYKRPLTRPIFSVLVGMLGMLREFKSVDAVLLSMERAGMQPSLYTYERLISSYISAGILDKAESLFERLSTMGVKPTLQTYNSFIRAFSEKKDLLKVEFYLKKLDESGKSRSLITYNTLIRAYGTLGRMSNVLDLYEEMKKKKVDPDLSTFNTIIDSLASFGKMEEAEQIYHHMRSIRFRPDLLTFGPLLKCLLYFPREDSVSKALEYAKEMKSLGIVPNIVLCNSILAILCNSGDTRMPLNFLQHMKEMGVEPNEYSYRSLIVLFAKNQDKKMALEWYQKLLSRGFTPSKAVYIHLIKMFDELEDFRYAIRFIKEYQAHASSYKLPLNDSYFTLAFSVYLKANDIVSAVESYNFMKSLNLPPDSFINDVLYSLLENQEEPIYTKDQIESLFI